MNTNLIWQRSYTLSIPTNWVSGVYVARLTTGTNVTPQTTGKQSYIIFVVREDARTSDLLYQASVTTWQAYNAWGGSSTYSYPYGQTCHVGNANAAHDIETVSFNRPYAPVTCDLDNIYLNNLRYGSGAGEFFVMINQVSAIAWEYNMVRWLERQGYDVTYSTSVDTHRVSPANKGVKAFLSVGHDEYWSAPQRANVEAARDRGVNLCFFSSNVCYWQIHFDTNESVFSVEKKISDDYSYHGNWRGLLINNPEISLVGEEYFYINGIANRYNDIQMPTNLPLGSGIGGYHWAYDYSGLTNGQVLPGLLGYEADGCFDTNLCICGATPYPYSLCPGSNTVKLANSPIVCGETPSCSPTNGVNIITNGHSYITLYAACNGAQVFATGSMQWSWGLDDFPSYTVYPYASRSHPAAQQMTHNVLRTFSGRPTAPVIFANADSATSGNWTNHYGSEGYWIADNTTLTNLPSYAQITLTNQHNQVWADQSTNSRALLKPGSSNRIASAWTTTNSQGSTFTIDVNLTDANTHQVALYCVDWLGTGNVLEKIEVFDSSDTFHSLDTRSFQLPTNGVYLVWNLKGHHFFRITKPDSTTGNKAMVSGLFIGP